MKTANATPRPITETIPPFCANSDGAPAVVALTIPPVEVLEEFLLEAEVPFAAPDAVAFAARELAIVLPPVALATPDALVVELVPDLDALDAFDALLD